MIDAMVVTADRAASVDRTRGIGNFLLGELWKILKISEK
jgi:hypothetical protein